MSARRVMKDVSFKLVGWQIGSGIQYVKVRKYITIKRANVVLTSLCKLLFVMHTQQLNKTSESI